MIENYKNNLLRIRPSNISYVWFELFINNNSQGDFRSEESALVYGKTIIDNSIDWLKTIDQTTVIDQVWGEYLVNDIKTLNSLKLLSGYNIYEEIFVMYEGWTIEEFINKFK